MPERAKGMEAAASIGATADGAADGRLALSLFSGAGGLDLGLQASGWHILAQVEMDSDCAATLELQAARAKSGPRCLCARIEDIDPRQLRLSLGIGRGELGLLAGGPPCQPFTTTGLRQGINDRRASSAFPAYLRHVREFMPAALLLENVDGMLSAALRHRPINQRGSGAPNLAWAERKGSFLHWLLTELASLGYSVAWGVTESADHGVPQLRQRAVLIGILDDEPCFLPEASYGGTQLPSYRTLREALAKVTDIGPVQPLSERKKAVFRLIPAGGNWRDLPDHARRETMGAAYFATGGKSGWWRRLSWDHPAATILGMPDHSSTALIHPDEVRCLSLYECAAVQTFPKHVRFGGSPRSAYQQVGNAVPPLLGRTLGRHIARHLAGARLPAPLPPAWRHQSANRRIGTHGWCVPGPRGPRLYILAKPREDSVWLPLQDELRLA
jgi:DNA (cytosine-5)-methyltransferase 1